MVRATAEIINVSNQIIFMVISFIMLHNEQYERNTDEILFASTIVNIVFCYLSHAYFTSKSLNADMLLDLGQVVFMSCILAFLTPLLQSLTASFSDDTIVFLVCILIFIHCLYFEYQIQNVSKLSIVNSPISLNAIFFATILLGSRLSRNSSVFVLLLQSLAMFSFGAFFRQEMRRINRVIYETITVCSLLINFCLILSIYPVFAFIYLCFQTFLAFGLPLLFINAYRYKNDVRGPWDIPRIKEYDHLD